jgi:arginine deiminase
MLLAQGSSDTLPTQAPPINVRARWGVASEADRLTDVLLALPTHLALVPANSVSEESLRRGLNCCTVGAQAQHRRLVAALRGFGVSCHVMPAVPDAPDLVFARDAALMTPWGFVTLNPALPHRKAEAAHVTHFARSLGIEAGAAIIEGTIEGGDVCIVRPGLVIIGWSGVRTSERGARALATLFERRGWRAVLHRFDPHFLHLDTQFCMVDAHRAIAAVDVLDSSFLDTLQALGIGLIPATFNEVRQLGCNVLSLGAGRIISGAGQDRLRRLLRRAGYEVVEVDVDQFTRCGGGVHCLTLPLARMRG